MKFSPIEGNEARRATSRYSSVIGEGEAIVVPVLSLLFLLGLFSHQLTAQVVGALAALTVIAELGPALGHQFTSRFKLDRPADREPPIGAAGSGSQADAHERHG
ncbi:hypothetical protein [Streptomyces sp. NPDC096152]|uniref:hypothetical protein n=1 Tax=Streptomyces sp. NPDC096152 TaxID=3366078 RepID=UPI0037F2F0D8